MSLEIILIAFLVAILTEGARVGLRRVAIPRRAGPEGLDTPEVAEAYDRISSWPQFRLLRSMVVRKLACLKPAGTLADIGCGPGRLAFLIARRFPGLHVIGVDTAGEMIQIARSSASAQGCSSRVQFRLGDVSNLPMPDRSLDLAVSMLSLHHWSDPMRGLTEIHRVLRPGGQLLLFDLRRDVRRLVYWLLTFAQHVVVPGALRRAQEPLGSVQSSYSLRELDDLLRRSPFQRYTVEGGPGWAFVLAAKDPSARA
jgi:ubiquinone/menaquinone biosynthesis C-methylase UbiE